MLPNEKMLFEKLLHYLVQLQSSEIGLSCKIYCFRFPFGELMSFSCVNGNV